VWFVYWTGWLLSCEWINVVSVMFVVHFFCSVCCCSDLLLVCLLILLYASFEMIKLFCFGGAFSGTVDALMGQCTLCSHWKRW
jgi:hypothetical protein